jgi:hypothetical protein
MNIVSSMKKFFCFNMEESLILYPIPGSTPDHSHKQKMKIIAPLLLVLCLTGNTFSQTRQMKPVIDKPVYFDISPPLKVMARSLPVYDRTWKDGIVKNGFPPGTGHAPAGFKDETRQEKMGSILIDTAIVDFEGVANVGGFVPPDTHGDVGDNFFFQVVNCSYAIYNKSGAMVLGPLPNSSIWNGLPNNSNDGDAIVLYDDQAQRWLFSQFSLPNYPAGPFFMMIAVSQTPDPTGSWYRYQYQFSDMPDYPKFGVWPDGYYMTCNRFSGGKLGYAGVGAAAYDRTAMLAGNPDATRILFNFSPGSEGFITMMPSDCDGPFPTGNPPNYFTYIRANGAQHLGIYEFHADWTNPSNSTFGNSLILPVNAFSTLSSGIPQLGTTRRLDNLSDRLMYRLQYRKFSDHQSMVLNHSVDAGSGVAGVRWYELRNTGSGWSIYQQSTYAPGDGKSRWMASVAMDTAGSIAMGYSVSSSTMYPAIRYTGRFANDPLNQMTIAEKSIMEGNGSQTGGNNPGANNGRWGDYSALSVDPVAPTTFWYTTEYYSVTSSYSWQTRIGAFTFGNVFSAWGSATPSLVCFPDSSQLDVVAYGGSGNYVYSWTSIPAGFTSNLRNPVVHPQDTTKYAITVIDGAQVRHDTVTVTVIFPPTAFAGNDTTVCSNVTSFPVHGQAANALFTGWATSGDGYFTDGSALSTDYFPGTGDFAYGSVDLALIVFPISPCIGNINDMMHVTIDPCNGIPGSATAGNYLVISPNPAHGVTTVTVGGQHAGPVGITVSDAGGRVVFRSVLDERTGYSSQIDLTGYPRGIYFVKAESSNGVRVAKMLVE